MPDTIDKLAVLIQYYEKLHKSANRSNHGATDFFNTNGREP